ncbi:MAG TPA: acyl-protein synthetase, partial [Actinomycetota bacterium]|nr:acyl-protein synthetase [Actinomycetota bacterium]
MRSQAEREAALLPVLGELIAHHRRACPAYDRILAALGVPADRAWERIADLPWLPVGLFKRLALKSIPDKEVFRVLTSSGTTGAEPARIYLDRATATAQGRALAAAMAPVLGARRLPMLIVDSAAVTRSGSARGAGVLGMATFGRDHAYALDSDGRPDAAAVGAFLARHGSRPFLTFGFTFMVWLY